MNQFINLIRTKPLYIVFGLFVFHIVIASMMSWIAYSPYLTSLHNGNGFWYFSSDSIKYHNEALSLLPYIENGDWSGWWYGIYDHQHVRWIALLYWLFNTNMPILFEIFNSSIWVLSLLAVYFAVYIYSNKNIMLAIISSSFLFFPSVILTSTQLLRDPFYTGGMCFAIFGWAALYSESYRWQGVAGLVVGFFLVILMRGYMTPIILSIFIAGLLVLFLTRKKVRVPAIITIFAISILSFKGNLNHMPTIKGDGFVDPMQVKIENKKNVLSNAEIKVVFDEHKYIMGIIKSNIIERDGIKKMQSL